MKKIYAIAVMLLIAAGAYAQSGKSLYNKYSDSKDVSAVYISPAMFKLIGQLPDMDIKTEDGKEMNIAPLVRSFTGFYLLDVKDKPLADELRKEVQSMIRSGSFEMLMEVKDNGSMMKIYTVGDKNIISSLVLLAQENDSTQFICLEGTIDRKDFEKLMAESVK